MTTDELIEILKQYPGKKVVACGGECGYDEITDVDVKSLYDGHTDWATGEYADRKCKRSKNKEEIVILL